MECVKYLFMMMELVSMQALSLKSLMKILQPKRIIHVFGSAGLRDVSKRPLMGEASAEFADISIITEEDYRTEDPHQITEEIAHGFKKWKKQYSAIIDRKAAVHYAIDQAKMNDIVVITGKGHEKSLCREKKEYPWSDIDCVKAYVQNK